jgi:hypothetical protein
MNKTETTLFEKDNIKITDQRAVFGAKTFLIDDITAIRKIGPRLGSGSHRFLYFLILVCAYFELGGLISSSMMVIPVFILAAIGISITWAESFTVSIVTKDDAMKVFTSRKEAVAQEIMDALNTALAQAGNKRANFHTALKNG